MKHEPDEPHPDELHSDQHVNASGLPADDLDGLAEWIDAHNPPDVQSSASG